MNSIWKGNKVQKYYKYILLYSVSILSIFILLNYVDKYKNQSISFQKKALISQAQVHFYDQVNTRHWNAQFGGVYVKPINGLKPNPYLPDNTLKVDDNLTLIKINPAWMTRQLSELSTIKDFSFRITSLNPLNPNNKVTPFEKKALEYMQKTNESEYYEITKNNKFNYMGALVTDKSCLVCHAHQGYKVGDIRGGISVNLGTTEFIEVLSSIKNQTFIVKTIILLFLTSIVILIHIQLRNNANLQLKVVKRTKSLEQEKNYIHKILDANPDIIVVTNGTEIINANKGFFDFFEFKTIDEFLEQHSCICDYFITLDGIKFPKNRKIEGKNWCEYVAEHKNDGHVVELKKYDVIYHFSVNAVKLNSYKEILVILTDITELKQKDELLYKSEKMAAMGEMIGNIAHQWRQPLSVISTGATGMKMQKEYGMLTDDLFNESCETINKNAQYLSKTIDDFRDFIKGDKEEELFSLNDDIQSFLHLVESSIKTHNIKVILLSDENIQIMGHPNELIQCFINIFNNSRDAFQNIVVDNKYLFIKVSKNNNNINISIKDNAGGIPENIVDKIFEPYFTTKHKSQGTGLGLHMTYNLIVDSMNGSIKINNVTYNYENKEYKGAEFLIELPLS